MTNLSSSKVTIGSIGLNNYYLFNNLRISGLKKNQDLIMDTDNTQIILNMLRKDKLSEIFIETLNKQFLILDVRDLKGDHKLKYHLGFHPNIINDIILLNNTDLNIILIHIYKFIIYGSNSNKQSIILFCCK
jgi:hypothetical protein